MRVRSCPSVAAAIGLVFLVLTGCPAPVSPGVTGSLNLIVSWPVSDVESPSIVAVLTGASGPTTPLRFIISGNQGTFSSSTVPAGCSTLVLQLQDNGVVVEGVVELVRVAAGQSTFGSYALAQGNSHGGKLRVNSTAEMADAILVSMGGVQATLSVGNKMTATASATDGTTGVTWAWYLNGASMGAGPSLTLGSTLAAGRYRLDVTGFTGDGTRAGSATASFEVTATVSP